MVDQGCSIPVGSADMIPQHSCTCPLAIALTLAWRTFMYMQESMLWVVVILLQQLQSITWLRAG
jgi:hypothetical protein